MLGGSYGKQSLRFRAHQTHVGPPQAWIRKHPVGVLPPTDDPGSEERADRILQQALAGGNRGLHDLPPGLTKRRRLRRRPQSRLATQKLLGREREGKWFREQQASRKRSVEYGTPQQATSPSNGPEWAPGVQKAKRGEKTSDQIGS